MGPSDLHGDIEETDRLVERVVAVSAVEAWVREQPAVGENHGEQCRLRTQLVVGAREDGRAQGRPVVDPRELRRRVALGVVLDPIEEERERPVAVGQVPGDVPCLHQVKREPGRLLAELPVRSWNGSSPRSGRDRG